MRGEKKDKLLVFWEQTCAWRSTRQIEKGRNTNYHFVMTVISTKLIFFWKRID